MSPKRKAAELAQPFLKQSAKLPVKSRINESKASILATASIPEGRGADVEAIEISSDSSSNYDEVELSEAEEAAEKEAESGSADVSESRRQNQNHTQNQAASGEEHVRGKRLHDAQDADTDMLGPPPQTKETEENSDLEPSAPTFGDLVRESEVVDVAAALAPRQEPTPGSLVHTGGAHAQHGQSQTPAQQQSLAPNSISSFSTLLNQALHNNDDANLEICLNITDLDWVRNTIQRMESRNAGKLLKKVATRMHRKPGRATTLMAWVQWTLVAHGGALASQADVVRELTELNRVLTERARGLNSLLMLKGKLDMLEAQMQLRRANKSRGAIDRRGRGGRGGSGESSEDDDDEGRGRVTNYIEGEEDVVLVNGAITETMADGLPAADDEEADVTMTNGVADSDDDEDEDEDGEEELDLVAIDDEEAADEDEVDHEDVETGEEDDSEVEPAAPPAKLQKTAKAFAKRR